MKALTIRQPWAGAIVHQTKRVENRTWKLPAAHHGARILIHAGAQLDKNAQVYGPNLGDYGAIIGIATITGYDLKKVKSHIQNGKRNLKICMERNEKPQARY